MVRTPLETDTGATLGLRINASTGAIGAHEQVSLSAEDLTQALARLLGGLEYEADSAAGRAAIQQVRQVRSALGTPSTYW